MSGLLPDDDPRWRWRTNMDVAGGLMPGQGPQQPRMPDLMTQGPQPTGSDRLRESIAGLLGAHPQGLMAQSASRAADLGTMGMLTGAYDGGAELAKGQGPGALGMALMPGAKVAAPAAKVAGKAATEAVQGIRGFHGSKHDFDAFDGATWLSSDKGYAEGMAGRTARNKTAGHMYDVQANVKSPYVVDVMEEAKRAAKSENMPEPTTIVEAESMLFPRGYPKAVESYMPDVKKGGHDSIHFKGTDDGFGSPTDQYLVFDDSLIEILRKYGIIPPAVAGASGLFGAPPEKPGVGLMQ